MSLIESPAMSPSTFTLRLPTDGSFPGLLGAVTSRLLDLSEVAADEAARVEGEVTRGAFVERAEPLRRHRTFLPDSV